MTLTLIVTGLEAFLIGWLLCALEALDLAVRGWVGCFTVTVIINGWMGRCSRVLLGRPVECAVQRAVDADTNSKADANVKKKGVATSISVAEGVGRYSSTDRDCGRSDGR